MKRSTDRILTTHVGSLIRPTDVLTDILLKVAGKPVDEAKFQEYAAEAKAKCPVSKALAAVEEITVNARLID